MIKSTHKSKTVNNLWKCDNCKNQNQISLLFCLYCQQPHQKNYSLGIKCAQCTYENHIEAVNCQICGYKISSQFLQNPREIKLNKQTIINCSSCNFQNDLSNVQCLRCENDLLQNEKKKCTICKLEIRKTIFDQHQKNCLLSHELIKKQVQAIEKKQQKIKYTICNYCKSQFVQNQIQEHYNYCQVKKVSEKNSINKLIDNSKSKITELQMQAIKHMHQKSSKQHNSARSALEKKIKTLGFKKGDLQNLNNYIQNYAPIIIHIHISKHMEFFVKDTHYRNQFQTNKSSGSLSRQSRTTWQDRMFDKKYSKATDFQRVKYGTINFTNDPKGVKCCSSYGPSYFLLKPHVRQRCTFTDKDSSNADSVIATFKYCFGVLSKLSDAELKAALQGARAMQVSSNVISTYKEIQIHGPIQFNKDIERIYVSSNQIKGNKKLLQMVYQFSKINSVDHDFI